MQIQQFTMGPVMTNCYLVTNEKTKETVIIDPAVCPAQVLDYIEEHAWKPVAILLTHGHFDHMMGVPGFVKKFDIPVYVLDKEQEILESPEKNLSQDLVGEGFALTGVTFLRDKQELRLGGMHFQVFHTPGHTLGGCCYYMEEEKVVFSGDTLFCCSVGRTDFATGSMSELIRSIKERLLVLPNDTTVLPGHNETTTIGAERRDNPYL